MKTFLILLSLLFTACAQQSDFNNHVSKNNKDHEELFARITVLESRVDSISVRVKRIGEITDSMKGRKESKLGRFLGTTIKYAR